MENMIKYLDHKINDELEGAEDYYNAAIKAKEDGNMEHVSTYMNLGMQELSHAEALFKMQDDSIAKYEAKYPDSKSENNMYKDIWNSYRHEKMDKHLKLKDKMSKIR